MHSLHHRTAVFLSPFPSCLLGSLAATFGDQAWCYKYLQQLVPGKCKLTLMKLGYYKRWKVETHPVHINYGSFKWNFCFPIWNTSHGPKSPEGSGLKATPSTRRVSLAFHRPLKVGTQREVTAKSSFEAAKAGQQLQQTKQTQLWQLFSPKAQKKVVNLASQCHFQTQPRLQRFNFSS